MRKNVLLRVNGPAIALDLFFSMLVGFGYLVMLGLPLDSSLAPLIFLMVALNLAKTLAWTAYSTWTIWPVRRWIAADPDVPGYSDITVRAAQAVYRAPVRVALFSMVPWLLLYTTVTAIILYGSGDLARLSPAAMTAAVIYSGSLALGAFVAVVPLHEYLLAPYTAQLSLTAERAGLDVRTPVLSLQMKISAIALGLALGPTGFVSSVAFMADARGNLELLEMESQATTFEISRQLEESVRHGEDPESELTQGEIHAIIGITARERQSPFIIADGRFTGDAAGRVLEESPVIRAWLDAHVSEQDSGVYTDPHLGRSVTFLRVGEAHVVGSIARLEQTTTPGFVFSLLLFVVVVLAWAPISAAFLSKSTARAITEVAATIERVRQEADVSEAPWVPIYYADEIGTLAAGTNDMIRRLDASHREAREYLGQLEAQNADLEQASRTKSEFLAHMSHELRTPLNTVIGFSKIIARKAEGKLPQEDLDNLKLIQQGGLHLLALVNDMLDLERIEAGSLKVQFFDIPLDSVFSEVEATLRLQAEERGVELVTRVDAAPLRVRTDPDRLRQVLINLVSNAIKYSDDGTVQLLARRDVGADGAELRIEVLDEGHGIAPDELHRIFEPFYRVDSSATRRREGTGLGLSIVSRITDLLHGRIEVESTIGKGSRFTLVLPGDLLVGESDERGVKQLRVVKSQAD